MRRQDKIRSAQIDAHIREHQRKHAAYFAFLDRHPHKGAHPVDALMQEFGIGLGEANAAWMHWLVMAADGGTPLERARGMGGM